MPSSMSDHRSPEFEARKFVEVDDGLIEDDSSADIGKILEALKAVRDTDTNLNGRKASHIVTSDNA
jgi:hypothetical protein